MLSDIPISYAHDGAILYVSTSKAEGYLGSRWQRAQPVSQPKDPLRENRLADAKQNFVEALDLCRAEGGVALARALTGLGQIEETWRTAILHAVL